MKRERENGKARATGNSNEKSAFRCDGREGGGQWLLQWLLQRRVLSVLVIKR